MDPFVGQIRMFGGNFAPTGYALCDGQFMPVAQNDALFSLLGTIYGGDGQVSFALPDLRGRLPVHIGTGQGLSQWGLGMASGSESVTLAPADLPSHWHAVEAMTAPATAQSPSGGFLANSGSAANTYHDGPANLATLASGALSETGGSQAHDNMMPALCISFIMAIVGAFPSRN